MATPVEYCITYKKTNQNDTTTGNNNVTISKGGFAISGDTNQEIGKITKITFKHQHAAVGSGTWKLRGRLNFPSQKYIYSDDIVSKYMNGTYGVYVNTFTTNLPTPSEWEAWTGATIVVVSSGNGTLHWMATSSRPMEIKVYFLAAKDIIKDSDPPTVDDVKFSDSGNHIGKYGNIVQGMSSVTGTGSYALDPRYEYLTANHTLVLKDSSDTIIYNQTQENNAVFSIGTIASFGLITWTYTVLDSAGKSNSKSGTITVIPYTRPTLSNFVVERYSEDVDSHGDTTHVPSEDGEYVWISFNASVAPINNKNKWNIKIDYGKASEGKTTKTILTVNDGSRYTAAYSRDEGIISSKIGSSDAWEFVLTLTDDFGNVTASTASYNIDKATALFDIEENGVSVGMLSTGTSGNKKFEVFEDYTAYFYGGINIDWKPLTLQSGTGSLYIGKLGSHVFIRGTVTAASGATLVKLGDGFKPNETVHRIEACGGFRVARLAINTDGDLIIEFVCNLTDGAVHTTAVWICCDMDYWV